MRFRCFAILLGSILLLCACGTVDYTAGEPTEEARDEARRLLVSAYSMLQQRNFSEAETNLDKAKQLDPKNPWITLNMGVLYHKTGRLDLAKDRYAEVLSTPSGLYKIAEISKSLKNVTSATDIARVNLELIRRAEKRGQQKQQTVQKLQMGQKQQGGSSPNRTIATPVEEHEQGLVDSALPEDLFTSEILKALSDWRQAISSRDSKAYFSAYVQGFKGADSSPEAWRASRRRFINDARGLYVQVLDTKLAFQGEKVARLSFTQNTRWDDGTKTTSKTLVFRLLGSRWLIEEESPGTLY